MALSNKYGLIAGNGKFPFLVLEAARSRGIDMVVAAIKEETFPEIEQHANTVHWMSLGQLGKLIKTFKAEGVSQAVMAGQVKHKQIFSGIVPDLKMIQLLASLATKNTDSLIGAVAKVLEQEGIAARERLELEHLTARRTGHMDVGRKRGLIEELEDRGVVLADSPSVSGAQI